MSGIAGRACRVLAAIGSGLVLAACGSGADLADAPPPREGRAGVQAAGRVGDRQVAVSSGSPRLTVGDCDPGDGGDRDVCAITTDIDGQLFVLVFENPDVRTPGAILDIADPGCGAQCDDVSDVAVVDVQVGVGERRRAVGGSLRVGDVEPLLRYPASADLELPDGRLQLDVDLVPRRD